MVLSAYCWRYFDVGCVADIHQDYFYCSVMCKIVKVSSGVSEKVRCGHEDLFLDGDILIDMETSLMYY